MSAEPDAVDAEAVSTFVRGFRAETDRRELQFQADYEGGRRFGLSEAQGLVYDLADPLPDELRRTVLDTIWRPLRDQVAALRRQSEAEHPNPTRTRRAALIVLSGPVAGDAEP